MSVDARLVVGDGDRLETVGTVHISHLNGWIAAARFTVAGEPGILTVQILDAAALVEALIDCADQIVCAAHHLGVLDDAGRLIELANELHLRLVARIPTDRLTAAIREHRTDDDDWKGLLKGALATYEERAALAANEATP